MLIDTTTPFVMMTVLTEKGGRIELRPQHVFVLDLGSAGDVDVRRVHHAGIRVRTH